MARSGKQNKILTSELIAELSVCNMTASLTDSEEFLRHFLAMSFVVVVNGQQRFTGQFGTEGG